MIKAKHPEELALLEGIGRSDRAAIQQLYRKYLPDIIAFVRKNNGTEDDGQDLFQEAVIVLFRKVQENDLELTSSLGTYLKAICRYKWLDRLKKHSVKKERKFNVNDSEEFADPDQNTIALIQKNDQMAAYQKAFLRLGEKCQTILRLFFQKVPMKKIAEQFDSTEGYIKKRKGICRDKLFTFIKEDPAYEELKHG